MKYSLKKILATALLSLGFPATSHALSCSVTGYQTLFQFDYDSAFPLHIMGSPVIPGGDVGAPPGATRQTWCKCGQEPWVRYGYTKGMWVPTRFVEVVREAGCSPVYGSFAGSILSKAVGVVAGTASSAAGVGFNLLGGGEGFSKADVGFRHFHSWSFPLTNMYSGMIPWTFVKGKTLESSLFTPGWTAADPVYGNILYPEWVGVGAVTGSPLFDQAAHTASCLSNSSGFGGMSDDLAYWLGGCMGQNLPAVGATSSERDSVVGAQTIVNRSIMASNRTFGYASVSNVGDKALCGAVPVPYPSKSEFKAAMLFPYPESDTWGAVDSAASGNFAGAITGQISGMVKDAFGFGGGAHRLGASSMLWGSGKNDQALNPNDTDAVYLVWRWVDACEF